MELIVLDLKKSRENLPTHGPCPVAESTAERYPPGFELIGQTLTAIQRCVLANDTFADLAEKVDQIKTALHGSFEAESLARCADEIRVVLETFQNRARESKEETAVDFKSILNLVNESVACIQESSSRSDERLKHLEESLKQAAKMESLVSVRRHLSEMLTFVRQESTQNLSHRDTSLKSITDQLRQANAKNSRLRLQIPGRLEALEYFKTAQATSEQATSNGSFGSKTVPQINVTLFAANSLPALRARHGNDIASNILEELGRKRIQPLAPDAKVFCWSNSALILLWQPDSPGLSPDLLRPAPFAYETRAFVGTRMATFKLEIRPLATSLIRGTENLITILDRFCKEQELQ